MPLHLGNSQIETISSYDTVAAQPGVLQAFEMITPPTKSEYVVGEYLDFSGAQFKATIDGQEFIVPYGKVAGDKGLKITQQYYTVSADYPMSAAQVGEQSTSFQCSLNGTVITLTSNWWFTILAYKADSILENNSWETIAQVAAAGKAQEYWNIGDTKTLYRRDGTTKFSTARIVAFDHYDYTEGGSTYNSGKNKTGITFWLEDGIGQMGQMESNPTKYVLYSASDVHNVYCHSIIPDQIEQDIKSFIKTVTVVKTTSVADTFSASFFVPSAIEFGYPSNSNIEDGSTIFPYFSSGNSKTYSNYFWTRSPNGWLTDDEGQVQSFFLVSKQLPATAPVSGYADAIYLILPVFNI